MLTPILSSRYDQHASLHYSYPQSQPNQHQHEYIGQDSSSSTLFMQTWTHPTYPHQQTAFHDSVSANTSLLANEGFQSSSSEIQYVSNNNVAPGTPSSMSSCLSDLSSPFALQGSHISSPATITDIDSTAASTSTSHVSSTTNERLSIPDSRKEEWKHRAHEAIWATNSYQRKKCHFSTSQNTDDNTRMPSYEDDKDDEEQSGLLQHHSSQSSSSSTQERRTITGYSVTCKQCNIHFTRVRDLRRHTLSKHVRQRYVCDRCSNTFTRNDSKVRHQRKCKSRKKRNHHDQRSWWQHSHCRIIHNQQHIVFIHIYWAKSHS